MRWQRVVWYVASRGKVFIVMLTETVEEFRIIPFAPAYAVSNLGRVRRVSDGRMLTPSPCARGYLGVCLSIGLAKPTTFYVHRLVGFCFLSLTPDMVINHKNTATMDCRLENLECTTQLENVRASHRTQTAHLLLGESNPQAWGVGGKLDATTVRVLRRAYAAGQCIAKLAREYGVSDAVAGQAARGDSYQWVKETAALTAIARAEALAARAVRKTLAMAARAAAARAAHTFPVDSK